MKTSIVALSITLVILGTNLAFAGADTGFHRIIDLGCSRPEKGGECFVTIDAPPFGPTACRPGSQARWAVQKENGRTILGLLMAAWAADARVSLFIEDYCWVQPSSGATWPLIGWVHIRHEADAP